VIIIVINNFIVLQGPYVIIDKLCDIFDKIRLPDTFQPASGADQHSLQLFDIARAVQWSVGEDGRKRKSLGKRGLLNLKTMFKIVVMIFSSVTDPDPGSGAFLTLNPGSGIGFFPDPGSRYPGSQTYIFDSFVTKFW
jgi:hypothetical protein